MNKIVIIADIHGHDTWKKIVEQEEDYDLVIFLGDYWDSFSVPSKVQKTNYLEIQQFRESNPDKVITLIGNHDFHYIYPVKYSGWKSETQFLSRDLLEYDIRNGKLPYAYKIGNILFSHAGITNYWKDNIAKCTLEELLKGKVDLGVFHFNTVMGYNSFGDTISNSPIWVRPKSLIKDAYKDYIQVVGHTHFGKVLNPHQNRKLWFCDTLPFEYLVIEDGEFIIKKL